MSARAITLTITPKAAEYLARVLDDEHDRATHEPNYDPEDMDELVALIALLGLVRP